jgi:hypothetical protein
MAVASPVDVKVNPNDATQRYILWGNGRIDAIGGLPPIVGQATWYDWVYQPVAVALQITNWTTGAGYMLDLYGAFQPINGAPAVGTGGIMGGVPYNNPATGPGGPLYIDWAWNTNGSTQGYVLDQYGQTYPFGGATPLPRTGPKWSWPAALKLQMRFTPDVRGVIMDVRGGLHGEGAVSSFGSLGNSWPTANNARDFGVTDWTAPSGYKLDLFGGLHAFGTAVVPSGFPYRPGADVARCLAVLSASNPLKFLEVWSGGQQYEFVSSTPPSVSAGSGVNEIQQVTIAGTPTGGTFTLTYSGQTTAAIARNATAATVDTALEALSNIGAGNVSVAGGPGPSTPWTVTFTGTLAATNVAQMTSTSSLTGGTGGTDEVQTITITGAPTGGTFTVTFGGQTTAAQARTATAGTLQTALQALSSIGAGNVLVTGGPGPTTPYVVTFAGALASSDVAQMTAAHTFTGGTTPNISVSTTTPGVSTPVTVTTGTSGVATSPAPSVTTTTRPDLTWSYSDPQSESQAAWQLYVFTQAFATGHDMTDPAVWAASALVAESGINRSTRGITSPVDLANGTYRMYVRAQDTAGLWSAWSNLGWTQAITPPVTPTSLSATANQSTFLVVLSVTATTGGSANLIRFEYLDSDSSTWLPVRGADAVTLASTTTATDYDPRLGVTRTYRAVAYAINPAVASTPSTTAAATITAGQRHVLTAVSNPALGGAVNVQNLIEWSRPVVAGVFQGLGAEYVTVVSDGVPKSRRGSLTLVALDAAGWSLIENLLEADSMLLHRDPLGHAVYCRAVGDWTQGRLVAMENLYGSSVPLVEVRPPNLAT